MTDLDTTSAGTRTCPSCGAQNAADLATCVRCGAVLEGAASDDAARGDLELEEVWRAAGAEGYDGELAVARDGVVCATCDATIGLGDDLDHWWAARDTPSNRDDVVVVAVRCPACTTAGRAAMDGPEFRRIVESTTRVPLGEPSEVPWRRGPPSGSDPDHPLGADRRFFDEAKPGSLADQGPLVDAEGRTSGSTRVSRSRRTRAGCCPASRTSVPGTRRGGGEWPDPSSRPAQTIDDEPSR